MMLNRFFSPSRFAVIRAWRIDRSGTVTWAFLIAVAIASTIAAFSSYRGTLRIESVSAQFGQTRSSLLVTSQRDAGDRPKLKAFHSHELLDALNGASLALALPVNEMVFRLDDNPAHPYLRYSATVKLFGGYPAVRKFVATVREPLPDTSLDAISCARTDIRSVHVSCELTLSAFYRRESPHA